MEPDLTIVQTVAYSSLLRNGTFLRLTRVKVI